MRRYNFMLFLALLFGITGSLILYFNRVVIPKEHHKAEIEARTEIDEDAMPKVKVAVVADEGGIARYTVLTEDIINSKIKIVDMPVKYAVSNAATGIDVLKNKIAKEDLRYGEQIAIGSLSSEKTWYGEYQRLKEYRVSNTVAGEVKTGNIVDIIVNYGNGDYDVVISQIRVHKVINEAAGQNQNARNQETVLILAVDEEQYRNMEAAARLGKIETRLYLDESQPPSVVTFNYENALQKMNLLNINEKLTVNRTDTQDAKQSATSLPALPATGKIDDEDAPIVLGN